MSRLSWLLVILGISVIALATRNLDKLKALISGEEGERLTVYPDTGGAWTIGKGHLVTPADTVMRNGRAERIHPYGPVREITQAESDALFERDTAKARAAVEKNVLVPITDNQYNALASLAFNIGVNAFASSTLIRKLNARDYAGAADQFDVWVWDNGVKVPGLIKRRAREKQVFLS
jgi:lysozyme